MLQKILNKINPKPRSVPTTSAINTPILIYHSVDNENSNALTSGEIHNINPNNFYTQLKELKNAYSFVYIDELVERIKNKQTIKNLCSVTFDDGYASVMGNAYPILVDLGIPSTFFISTNILKENSFWRDKIRYLINKGLEKDFLQFSIEYHKEFKKIESGDFYWSTKDPEIINSKLVDRSLDEFFIKNEINIKDISTSIYTKEDIILDEYELLNFGNHSQNHYVLSSLSKDEQYEEINNAHTYLKSKTSNISSVFSVPFGGLNTFDNNTLEILEGLGYNCCALSSGNNIRDIFHYENKLKYKSELLFLNRFMPSDRVCVF